MTGTGRAPKSQVKTMVRRLLSLECTPAEDAADALAVAIRHAGGARLEAAGRSSARRPGGRRSSRFVVSVRSPR